MNEYSLSTIKDIYEKIPYDRIDDLMAELTILIKRAQTVNGLLKAVSKDVCGKEGDIKFPDTITWNDDGKGTLTIKISINETPVITVEEKIL